MGPREYVEFMYVLSVVLHALPYVLAGAVGGAVSTALALWDLCDCDDDEEG